MSNKENWRSKDFDTSSYKKTPTEMSGNYSIDAKPVLKYSLRIFITSVIIAGLGFVAGHIYALSTQEVDPRVNANKELGEALRRDLSRLEEAKNAEISKLIKENTNLRDKFEKSGRTIASLQKTLNEISDMQGRPDIARSELADICQDLKKLYYRQSETNSPFNYKIVDQCNALVKRF